MNNKKLVNEFFKRLRKEGYFARQNLGDCQSCGCALVPDEYNSKYVFYHSQDKQSAEERGKLYLAWAGNGTQIASIAQDLGFSVDWNGLQEQRIALLLN